MKKIAIALAAVAASMLSGTVMAQAYVSGDVGVSHISVDCTGTTLCDTKDTAVKFTGGYGFGNGFAAELGYISFGKAKVAGGGVTGDIKVDGLTLAAAYRAAINADWAFNARLGIARLKTRIDATLGSARGSSSDTTTAALFGLGVDYAVTKNLKLEFGADFSRAKFSTEKASVRALTAGLRLDF